MRRRDLAEGLYVLVWVRGLYGPQPQVWGEDAFYGPVAERERVVLAVRRHCGGRRKSSRFRTT